MDDNQLDEKYRQQQKLLNEYLMRTNRKLRTVRPNLNQNLQYYAQMYYANNTYSLPSRLHTTPEKEKTLDDCM